MFRLDYDAPSSEVKKSIRHIKHSGWREAPGLVLFDACKSAGARGFVVRDRVGTCPNRRLHAPLKSKAAPAVFVELERNLETSYAAAASRNLAYVDVEVRDHVEGLRPGRQLHVIGSISEPR